MIAETMRTMSEGLQMVIFGLGILCGVIFREITAMVASGTMTLIRRATHDQAREMFCRWVNEYHAATKLRHEDEERRANTR